MWVQVSQRHSNIFDMMATLDKILGGTPHGGDNPPKDSKEWAEQQQQQTVDKDVPAQQTVAPPVQQQQAQTVVQDGGQPAGEGFYEQFYKKTNPYKELTPEEEEKERKKQRREKMFAAIGDGIAALSNLYFTTQGAPSMYDEKNTLSERARVSYDKLKKERDEQRTAYYNGLMKARQADEAARNEQNAWKRQLQLDTERREAAKAEAKRKEAEDARKETLAQLQILLQQGKISEQAYRAKKAQVESEYAGKVQQSIISKNNSGGRKAEFIAYDADGNEHFFTTDKAAEWFARQQGTWVEDEYDSSETREAEEKNRKGEVSKSTTTTTTTKKTKNGRSVKPEKQADSGSPLRNSNKQTKSTATW